MVDRLYTFTNSQELRQRLDKFLVNQLPEFSRSRLQGLIADGFVMVDEKVATKSGSNVEPGQVVQIRIPPTAPSQVSAEEIPLDIIYEDPDLIVVNKPAGMVVHPAAGHSSGTLVNAALAHAPEMEGIGGELRPGVVHRLDKDTSGLILLAKNDRAQHWLQDQFRDRDVKKTYIALVDGHPPTPQGRIDAPIGRDPIHRKKMAIVTPEKGRAAVTEYKTLANYSEHTLLELHPQTGRTHQIRLHLAFLGTPIVGDTVYGHRHPTVPLNRHFLHAARLTFTLPETGKPIHLEAPLPPELEQVLNTLEKYPDHTAGYL